MRYYIEVRDGDKLEKQIKNIFPHIAKADFETFLQDNKAGVVILDKEAFLKRKNPLVEFLDKNEANFVIVILGDNVRIDFKSDDILVAKQLDDTLMNEVRIRILNKMENLTRERIKNRQREELQEYEDIGIGVLIIDDQEKIVHANDLFLNMLGNSYSIEKLLNMKVNDLFKQIAPDLHFSDLIKERVKRYPDSVKFVLPDGTEKKVWISLTRRIRADGKFDGYILYFREPLENVKAQELLDELARLTDEIERISPNIENKFFEGVTKLIKRLSEILQVRSVFFVPFHIARIWKYEDEAPFIVAYFAKGGKYVSKLIYGYRASERDKKRCVENYSFDKFMKLYRNPEDFMDPGESEKIYSVTKFLEKGSKIYGVLCLDRHRPFDELENRFIRLFTKDLTSLMETIERNSRVVNLDLVKKFSFSLKDSAIVLVNEEAVIEYINDKFGKIFGLEAHQYIDSGIDTIPGLKNNQVVLEKVQDHIFQKKPLKVERWIKLRNKEKYMIITGIPYSLGGRDYYIWIFEDKTQEKFEEIKSRYIKNFLKWNACMSKNIKNLTSGKVGRDDLERAFSKFPQIIVECTENFADGILVYLQDPVNEGLPCDKDGPLFNGMNSEKACGFLRNVEEYAENNAMEDKIFLADADNFKKEEFKNVKMDGKFLYMPITSDYVETNDKVGTLIMFAKKDSDLFRFFNFISESNEVKREFDEIFDHTSETISDLINLYYRDVKISKNERVMEEFHRHSRDLFVLTSDTGEIKSFNEAAESIIGEKLYPGQNFIEVLNRRSSITMGLKIDELFDLNEGEENSAIVVFDLVSDKKKWIRLVVKRLDNDYILVGHDMTQEFETRISREQSFIGLIAMLLKVLSQKSIYLSRHSINVAFIVKEILEEKGNSGIFREKFEDENDRFCLLVAAVLHDIGKISMASSYLNKPFEELMRDKVLKNYYEAHPYYGADLLEDIGLPCDNKIPLWIRQHHERMDGSGFPRGLKGDDISLGARIIGIADEIENAIVVKPRVTQKDLNQVLDEMTKSNKFDREVLDIVKKINESSKIKKVLSVTEKIESENIKDLLRNLFGPFLSL